MVSTPVIIAYLLTATVVSRHMESRRSRGWAIHFICPCGQLYNRLLARVFALLTVRRVVIEKCVTVVRLKQFGVAHYVACCYWKGCTDEYLICFCVPAMLTEKTPKISVTRFHPSVCLNKGIFIFSIFKLCWHAKYKTHCVGFCPACQP